MWTKMYSTDKEKEVFMTTEEMVSNIQVKMSKQT